MAQLQGFLIKRAMSAQQDARARAAAAAAKSGSSTPDSKKTAARHLENKSEVGEKEDFVIGVKGEEDSVELEGMLSAARRAVADIGAFVAGGADDADVGVSL